LFFFYKKQSVFPLILLPREQYNLIVTSRTRKNIGSKNEKLNDDDDDDDLGNHYLEREIKV